MADPQQQITTETALKLLAKQPRRRILRLLAETPDGTTVDRLGSLLAADSADPTAEDALESRMLELHHVHLPMLQDANVVEYDATRETVRHGRQFQEIVSLLGVIDSHRDEGPSAHS